MKIAIIDSGINSTVFPDTSIKQIRIYDHQIIPESPHDYIGHGTAVTSIAVRECPNVEIVSICPGIGPNKLPDKIITSDDLALAIQVAIDECANIINISMGTTMFCNRKILDDICQKAAEHDILIIAAEAPDAYPSLPWGCNNVIRVKAVAGKDFHVSIEENSGLYSTLAVHGEMYRILTKDNKKYFATGNSYAAPYIVNLLLKAGKAFTTENLTSILNLAPEKRIQVEKMLNEKVHLLKSDLPFINEAAYKSFKNLVLLPFNKEMHSIVRFNKEKGYRVVGIIDSSKKGTINRDAGDLLGLGHKGITIYKHITDIDDTADTLVIGHLDEIYKYDKTFDIDVILEQNLRLTQWNVFSFIPISMYWISLYREKGLTITTPPIIDEELYNTTLQSVKYKVPISKPVIGVFGTSSSQGKFTLQIEMLKSLEKKNCSCFHLSTEHHGGLFGAGFIFADGYANTHTVKLPAEKTIDFLKRIMVYIDNNFSSDLILIGGQSRLIPYDINEQTFMRNAVFLEGTLPDLSVLVINPLIDVAEYVDDTINALKSIYKCQTIALAFSDYTLKADETGRLFKVHLSVDEIEKISQSIQKTYQLPCGCITDPSYIDNLTNKIVSICSDSNE